MSITNPRWTRLGLDPKIIDILSEKGITKFTPVQAEAFVPVIAGRHVIGRSRTGTGKTLAFGLPSLTRLVNILKENGTMDSRGQLRKGRKVSMVVLCPTRELARQVQEELAEVARPLGLFTEVFHGGVSYDPQSRALYNGLDVLVGTPGRVIDHLNRGNLDLSECNVVVLDEAGTSSTPCRNLPCTPLSHFSTLTTFDSQMRCLTWDLQKTWKLSWTALAQRMPRKLNVSSFLQLHHHG